MHDYIFYSCNKAYINMSPHTHAYTHIHAHTDNDGKQNYVSALQFNEYQNYS